MHALSAPSSPSSASSSQWGSLLTQAAARHGLKLPPAYLAEFDALLVGPPEPAWDLCAVDVAVLQKKTKVYYRLRVRTGLDVAAGGVSLLFSCRELNWTTGARSVGSLLQALKKPTLMLLDTTVLVEHHLSAAGYHLIDWVCRRSPVAALKVNIDRAGSEYWHLPVLQSMCCTLECGDPTVLHPDQLQWAAGLTLAATSWHCKVLFPDQPDDRRGLRALWLARHPVRGLSCVAELTERCHGVPPELPLKLPAGLVAVFQ